MSAATGSLLLCGDALTGATTTPGSGDPSFAAAELPLVNLARTIAANARAISAMSTAWPVDRSELRIGTVMARRP
jgi:hypothetical protein